jgi:hypothetical protein
MAAAAASSGSLEGGTCVSVQVRLLHEISIGRGQREEEEDFLALLLAFLKGDASGEPGVGAPPAPFPVSRFEGESEKGTQRTRQAHHDPPAGPEPAFEPPSTADPTPPPQAQDRTQAFERSPASSSSSSKSVESKLPASEEPPPLPLRTSSSSDRKESPS